MKSAEHRLRVPAASDLSDGANGVSQPRVPRLELIRTAALRHFAQHGYDAASRRQSGAHARIPIATLHFHCSTKEQLLFDVLEPQMRQLLDGLDAALAATPDDWSSRLARAIRFPV